jgi:DNA-binding NarL/FixJ family response regulator
MRLHSKAKQFLAPSVSDSVPEDERLLHCSNADGAYEAPLSEVCESAEQNALSPSSENHARSLRCLLSTKRWNLVETYERDGKQYVLARRDDVGQSISSALSRRERQALSFAAFGLSNKVIAYQMGICASTVGVLMHRAAEKIGCANIRAELLEHFRRLSGRAPISTSCL